VVEFHDRYFASDGSTRCLPLSGSPDFASYPAVRSEPARLRVRPSDSPRPPAPWVPEGTLVSTDRWRLTSDTEICLDGGFRPGDVYELTYTARDPRVMGLGYAATRDVVSFLRNGSTDRNGDANPLAIRNGVTAVLGHGTSSSGMYMRDYLYQGFNEDVAGRRVFDGVNIHIPGAHKLFLNYRFAQPNPFSVQHRDRYMPYVNFPFNYGVRRDPVSGRSDGILKRPRTDPLVTHTDSSTEYWQFQAGLVNTDGFGRDVRLPGSVRQFLLSGTQHGSGTPSTLGNCQQLTNPTDYSPALRAQIRILDEWVVSGTRPPASRAPSVAAGTLVPTNRSATRFPVVPGVTYNGLYNDAGERDYGPREQGNRGIIDRWRNPRILADYRVLVPRVDRVGIDLGGLELPVVRRAERHPDRLEPAPRPAHRGRPVRPVRDADPAAGHRGRGPADRRPPAVAGAPLPQPRRLRTGTACTRRPPRCRPPAAGRRRSLRPVSTLRGATRVAHSCAIRPSAGSAGASAPGPHRLAHHQERRTHRVMTLWNFQGTKTRPISIRCRSTCGDMNCGGDLLLSRFAAARAGLRTILPPAGRVSGPATQG
jgi:hypothetical protein